MTDENSRGVDLFGDPIPAERSGPGRPEHVWTLENSNKINLLFAMGHDKKDASKAIGISVPTLNKYYFYEVEQWRVARLRFKARQLSLLAKEAEAGNVGAIKELFKQMEKASLVALSASVANRGARPERKAPKLGKKEQRSEDARQVGGLYAPPPPPQPTRLN